MILIPKTKQVDALPFAPLDRTQMPTVDLSGVRQAVGQLGEASQTPLDRNDYAAPVRALGAFGEAVMKVGSIAGAYAEKKQEDLDLQARNKASLAMTLADAEYDAYKQSNPTQPQKWVEMRQKQIEKITSDYQATPGISSRAKETMGMMATEWSEKARIRSSSDRDAYQFRETATTFDTLAGQHYANGDIAAGDSVIEEAVKHGSYTPAQGMAQKFRGNSTALDTVEDRLHTQSDELIQQGRAEEARELWEQYTPPAGMEKKWHDRKAKAVTAVVAKAIRKEELDKVDLWESTEPGKRLKDVGTLRLNDSEKEMVRVQLQQAAIAQADDEVQTARLRIASLRTEELGKATVESLGLKRDKLSNWHLSYVQRMIEGAKSKSPQEESAHRAQIAEAYVGLKAKAAGWKPTGDAVQDDKDWAQLQLEIDLLPATLSEEVRSVLKLREGGDEVYSVIGDAIADVGRSAKQAALEPMKDEKGRPLMEEARAVGVTAKQTVVNEWWWDEEVGGETIYEHAAGADPTEQAMVPKLGENKGKAAQYAKGVKAVTEALEREAQNPATLKLWRDNPKQLHQMKEELMRRHRIPFVAPTAPDVIAPSLFPPLTTTE